MKPLYEQRYCYTKTISNSSGNRASPTTPPKKSRRFCSLPALSTGDRYKTLTSASEPLFLGFKPPESVTQDVGYRRHTTRNLRWAEYRTDVDEELTPIVELTPAPLPLLAPHMCQQSMSLLSPRSHLSPLPLFSSAFTLIS